MNSCDIKVIGRFVKENGEEDYPPAIATLGELSTIISTAYQASRTATSGLTTLWEINPSKWKFYDELSRVRTLAVSHGIASYEQYTFNISVYTRIDSLYYLQNNIKSTPFQVGFTRGLCCK